MKTVIDLQAWCHTERRSLSAPFVRGGFRYATDGRAMVRLPAPGESDTEDPLVPDASLIFAAVEKLTFAPWPADWESWETMEIEVEKEECPECHGETKECSRCDGSGQIECGECGQDYDCPDCEGKGYTGAKCSKCRNCGTIFKPGRAFRVADGVWVEERFLRRVVNLPALHYACKGSANPVFFRFDGGEAAMMPVIIRDGYAAEKA